MWLLLVAAGTGYLARSWQKSRRFKTGPFMSIHNGALHASQPCTPRRGCSTTSGRRGLQKRFQFARGLSRKLLQGRKEGRWVSTPGGDSDDSPGSPNKLSKGLRYDEDFLGLPAADQGPPGQVETHSLHSCLQSEHPSGPLLVLTSGCGQDHVGEVCFCMDRLLLSAANVDAREQDRLFLCDFTSLSNIPEKGSWRNLLNFAKITRNASLISASNTKVVPAVPVSPAFLRFKKKRGERRQSLPMKLKESTEKAINFFAQVARAMRVRKTLRVRLGLPLNTIDAPFFKSLKVGNHCNNILSEIKKTKQGLLYTQHSKALLDREFSHHCERYSDLPFPSSSYELAIAKSHATDFSGLGQAAHQRLAHVGRQSNDWDHSLGKAADFAKLTCSSNSQLLWSSENSSRSSNDVFFVALGLAMGVLVAATCRSRELEDLHRLLKENNCLMEQLKKKLDSRFEVDPLQLPEVEKVSSIVTVDDGACSQKVPLYPDIGACQSTGGDCLELFNASTKHEASVLKSHAHGYDDLEAELEAELELMELTVYNTDKGEFEWKQAQFTKDCQSEVGDNDYIDKPEGVDTSFVDIDGHDSIVIEDANELYEGDFVVPPSELERRLWQVLEQRHEERICELENDLQAAEQKLTSKENEIQWWKDRVFWLMERSPGGESKIPNPLCSIQDVLV